MADGDWEKLMRTPFLIYGNFEFKNGGLLKTGKDNSISSYNLLNAVSQLISAPTTPYMEFLTAYGNSIPYFNNRLKINTSESQNEFINQHKLLTYDILNGGKYSVKKK